MCNWVRGHDSKECTMCVCPSTHTGKNRTRGYGCESYAWQQGMSYACVGMGVCAWVRDLRHARARCRK